MSLSTLRQLEQFFFVFLTNTKLDSSRGGVGLSEEIAMFIDISDHWAPNREVRERFQEVLAAMLILHVKYAHSS